jgi:hypothetical protein
LRGHLTTRVTQVDAMLASHSAAPPTEPLTPPLASSYLSTCPNFANITTRLYNTFDAPNGIVLGSPQTIAVGSMRLVWLEANPHSFSPSYRKRQESTTSAPATLTLDTLAPDATIATLAKPSLNLKRCTMLLLLFVVGN